MSQVKGREEMSVDAPVEEVGKQNSGGRWGWRLGWGVVAVLVVGGIGVAGYTRWRVQEIPKVAFPPPTVRPTMNAAEILRGTDEDRELATRLVVEMSRVVKTASFPETFQSNPALFYISSARDAALLSLLSVSAAEKEWLEANRSWLLTHRVTEKEAGEIYLKREETLDEILKDRAGTLLDVRALHLIAARELIREKKLDEALDQILEGVRIERLIQKRRLPLRVRDKETLQWTKSEGPAIVPRSQEVLKLWSLCEGQTSERVLRAIPRVQREFQKFLRMPEKLMLHQEAARLELEEDLSLANVFAWERERARRLLNLISSADYVRICGNLANFQGLDEGPSIPFPSGVEGEEIEEHLKWLQSEGMSRDRSVQTVRRVLNTEWKTGHVGMRRGESATLLIMGLCAYRLDQGKLPERLADLLGKYFKVLPRDPSTLGDFGYLTSGEFVETGRRFRSRGTAAPLLHRSDKVRARGMVTEKEGTSWVVYEGFQNREGERVSGQEVIVIPPPIEELKKLLQQGEEGLAKVRGDVERRKREREQDLAELKKQGLEGEALERELARRLRERMRRERREWWRARSVAPREQVSSGTGEQVKGEEGGAQSRSDRPPRPLGESR